MNQWLTAFKTGLPLAFRGRTIPVVDLLWVFGDDGGVDTIRHASHMRK